MGLEKRNKNVLCNLRRNFTCFFFILIKSFYISVCHVGDKPGLTMVILFLAEPQNMMTKYRFGGDGCCGNALHKLHIDFLLSHTVPNWIFQSLSFLQKELPEENL